MIHWAWLILALFVGVIFGFFLAAILSARRDESHYRQGFCEGMAEGHAAGFKDGLAEWQKVG